MEEDPIKGGIMTYKQIETAREIRMWITRIFLPLGLAGLYVSTNPDAMNWLRFHKDRAKDKILKFKKKILKR